MTETTPNPALPLANPPDTLHVDRARLFATLAARGVALAVITFDGYGDDGQIQSVTFDDTESADLLTQAEVSPHPDGTPVASFQMLETWLDDFAWDALGALHCGWQDNDGAYGEITFDVAAGTVTLDFNARFVDAHNTVTEL
jgi:hypothetical protein